MKGEKGMLFSILMLFILPIFALMIHNYLRHGEVTAKKKVIFYVVYFVLINLISGCVSYMRGITRLDFNNMTTTFQIKYMGLGCILGFIMPFIVCLLFEEQITIGGMKRYTRRFIGDLKKYLPYAVMSAKCSLRSEVANSYLDWLWWLIEPFCMMLIYTVIFGYVFKASEQYFPIFIFIGITMWSFFSRSISGSVNTVRDNKGIITKVYMPKYILLFSKMLVNGFKMLVAFAIVIVMMIVFRVVPTANVLCAVPILIVLFLFTFGVGTIMMHYGVYVNDLGYITGIVLSMLMYFTGTFYSISKRIPEPFGQMIEYCNPVAFLIASMRNALLYGQTPSFFLLGLWGFLSLVLIALGAFTIYSNENAYVKVI